MKRAHRRRSVLLTLTVLLAVVASIPAVQRAYGAGITVGGYDHIFGGDDCSDGSIDVLSVMGTPGDTVYININRGDEVIANRLAFTLDDVTAQTDANGELIGVVSVVPEAGTSLLMDGASIEVYADRMETERLYEGSITSIYARYGDAGEELLASRTLAKGEKRAFDAPTTREFNGLVYTLVEGADPKKQDGALYYAYELANDAPETVDGHVSYYDSDAPDAEPLRVDTVEGIQLGAAPQAVEVPSIIATDDSLYRTLLFSDSLSLSYPGTTEYAISCKKLDDSWGSQDSFFTATIRYTDAEGNDIGGVKDKVIVNKVYRYTPPTYLYVRDDAETVHEYQLAANEDVLDERGVLVLRPGDAEGAQTYRIAYEAVPDDQLRRWTVTIENGAVDPSDPHRVLESKTYEGRPGDSAVYTTKDRVSFDIDGETKDFVPTASVEESYRHTFGVGNMDVTQTLYYVPAGYVAPEAYEIAVKYVNIADNKLIDTKTYTVAPTMRQDLEIATPDNFVSGGITWIRLNGQESPLRHGFYDAAREYVVYYRDVNDELHANTVIRTVRVVYTDEEGNTIVRPTTMVDNGTTTTEGDATGDDVADGTNAGGLAGDGTVTGLQTNQNLLAIDNQDDDGTDGADGDGLVSQDGTDLATTRIEDDATPLAGPGAGTAEQASGKVAPTALVAAGLAGAIALFFLLFFVIKRRKQGTDESSDDDITA